MRRSVLLSLLLVPFAAAGIVATFAADAAKPADAATERARKTVQMLDDIYKTAVVAVTETYVDDEGDQPAAVTFKPLFETMKKKGWHEVRLVDATGEPIEAANAPADDFEKEAIKQLKSGKPYYEQVVEAKGERRLRAATAVPVVMDKCILCHPHYKSVKKGDPIGALSYSLKIE